jgi:hypothetical protein
MSSTRTAGRRESRPTGARTARPSRTGSRRERAAGVEGDTLVADRPSVEDPSPLEGPTEPRRRRARNTRTGSADRDRSPRHRLLLASTAALAAGFFAVLLLNTIISQGAFRQHELEIQLILLAEEEEALAREVQQAEAPREVERAARKLGMVPAAAPVFLRLSDAAILGEPVPAPEPTAPVDFAGAPGIQPTPKPSPSDAASAGALDPTTGIDPALDPTTGIDPALDPATGLDTPVDPSAGPPPAEPAASPAPVVTQQGVNP